MNALLNIQIRVAANQARKEIASVGTAMRDASTLASKAGPGGLQGLVNSFGLGGTAASTFAGKLDKAGSALARGLAAFPAWNKQLEGMGKNLQWVGRQLQFNFTLPLAAAGFFATKWALDNERAITEVRKLYGGAPADIEPLTKTFELLSDRFGLAQKDVIDIGAAWASAGASGRQLADVTQATLETMTLSQEDATKATDALISMVLVYHLSTKQAADGTSELTNAIGLLNIVDDKTAIRFPDLIDVIQRAGGAASLAGIDLRHLAAMAAALVPAAGSGSAAGTALKTVISRLSGKPTKDTIDALKLMGIIVADPKWMGAPVQDKLEQLSKKFTETNAQGQKVISDSQRALIDSVIAGRWQINRFSVLMDSLGSSTGNYAIALAATNDVQAVNNRRLRDLNAILDSSPKRFDILSNVIKNNMARAIIPLLPMIQSVIAMFAQWAIGFSKLNPHTQRLLIFSALFIALVGPIVKYLGATITLFSELGKAMYYVGRGFTWVAKQVLELAVRMGIAAASHATAETAAALESAAAWANEHGIVMAMSFEEVTTVQAAAVAKAEAETASATEVAAAWTFANGEIIAGSFETEAAATGIFARLGTVIWDILSAIGTGIASFFSGIVEVVGGITGAIGTALVGVESVIASFFGGVADIAVGVVATVATVLGIPFEAAALLIAAVIAAIVLMLDKNLRVKVWDIMKDIGNAIWSLPRVFVAALGALIRVIATAVRTALHFLSYLNPFARHSPSLVDNVKAGISTILDQYARLSGVGAALRSAIAAQNAFAAATQSTQAGFDATERGKQRADVSKVAPGALPAFDNLSAQIDNLKGQLPPLARLIAEQSVVVSQWDATVKKLDADLKAQQAVVDGLEAQLTSLGDALSESKSRLDALGNTDLPGMRKASDEIFANQQAQKKLRLEIMKLEDAGQAVTDLNDKYAALNGMIEMMRSEEANLRKAGAGSDILSAYDDQINSLQGQADAITQQGSAVDDLQKQLDALQRQGEELDLQQSLDFDGPLRQIDQMISGLNEMPFDEIVSKIKVEQDAIAKLQPEYDRVKTELDKQKAVLDQIKTAHDAANDSLQIEQDKLRDLESAYSDINTQINDMEQNLSTFASNVSKSLQDAATSLQDLFDAGANQDFPDVTGTGQGLQGYGNASDIQAFNDQLQAQLDDILGNMRAFDPFGALHDKFFEFIDWLKNLGPAILDALTSAWSWAISGLSTVLSGLWGGIQAAWGVLWDAMGTAASAAYHGVIQPIWDAMVAVIQAVVIPVLQLLGSIFTWLWQNVVSPVVSAAWNFIHPILQAMVLFFQQYLLPVIQLFGAVVEIVINLAVRMFEWLWSATLPIWTSIISFISGNLGPIFQWLYDQVIKPVFDAIGASVSFVWENVLRPIFDLIVFVLQTIVGPVFMWLYNNVVKPYFDLIGQAIKFTWENVIQPILGALVWVFQNVVAPAFHWLLDNVIRPVWDAIGGAIQWVFNNVIRPVFDSIKWVIDNVGTPAFQGMAGVVHRVMDDIIGAIQYAFNIFKNVFNWIARGVNDIGSALGIHINIGMMGEPQQVSATSAANAAAAAASGMQSVPSTTPLPGTHAFASGGVIPIGKGFMTHGAQAIVGEGNPAYPEFVIPTDPKYRNNAQLLMAAAATAMGAKRNADGVPMMSIGGMISSALGGLLDDAKKIAAIAVWTPIKWTADHLADNIPAKFLGTLAHGMTNKVDDWVHNLATGGRITVPRTTGGVMMRVAEGTRSEQVQVLPINKTTNEGGSHNHFYGDLVFPNINSGDDAEKFIRNLENLAS